MSNSNSTPDGALPAEQSLQSAAPQPTRTEPARNEPCPCGSGKKYKRCHGVAAAPKITPPRAAAPMGMPPGMENMNPELMTQATQMLQRLPKGQLQKLQSIMQRAMAGKDVAQEAEAFQKTLPPDFQQMMTGFAAMAGMAEGAEGAPTGSEAGMTEEEARAIVAQAAEQGKLSQEKAHDLLQAPLGEAEKPSALGKLWKSVTGK